MEGLGEEIWHPGLVDKGRELPLAEGNPADTALKHQVSYVHSICSYARTQM